MILKRFDLRLVVLLVVSSLAGAVFLWTLNVPYLRATSAGLLIVWALLIIFTIYFAHRSRRDLERFFLAMKNQDISLAFQQRKSDPFFRNIHDRFNELILDFKLVRKEREQEHQFFMHTIEHTGVGVLAFDQDGHIHIINRALLELLNLQPVKELPQLGVIQMDFPDRLANLTPGDKTLMKLTISGRILHLSILPSAFKMNDKRITLASFQDISREIDKTEVETWQKLIRVLTHEIMNSISPLRLLASGLLKIFREKDEPTDHILLQGDSLRDTIAGLESIQKRSSGLTDFVESYRSLTRLPQPDKNIISISHLFKEIHPLYEEELKSRSIRMDINIVPPHLTILANEQLIIQVLINLVKNAVQALANKADATIHLKGYEERSFVVIEVTDNGEGIPARDLDSIFIPFYTTRESGTGIGLSLSKQIMYVHNGSIQVHSREGHGTTVKLSFVDGHVVSH